MVIERVLGGLSLEIKAHHKNLHLRLSLSNDSYSFPDILGFLYYYYFLENQIVIAIYIQQTGA